jgi:hypothetical protein
MADASQDSTLVLFALLTKSEADVSATIRTAAFWR